MHLVCVCAAAAFLFSEGPLVAARARDRAQNTEMSPALEAGAVSALTNDQWWVDRRPYFLDLTLRPYYRGLS